MPRTVFVDESGSFEPSPHPEADVLVLGLSFDSRGLEARERTAAKAFRARWPFVPWPPHAAHLHRPGWLPLAWRAWLDPRDLDEAERALRQRGRTVPADADAFRTESDRFARLVANTGQRDDWILLQAWGARRGLVPPGPGFELCRFAAAVGVQPRPPGAEALVSQLQRGRTIPWDAVRAVEPQLFPRGVPGAVERLRSLIATDVHGLASWLPGESTATLAAEAVPGAAAGEPDRYLPLLRALCSTLDPTDLTLCVQGRDVRVASPGGGVARHPLRQRDLEDCFTSAGRTSPPACRVDAARRSWIDGSTAGEPDEGWSAGHVLVDFAANRTRRWLGMDRGRLLALLRSRLGVASANLVPWPQPTTARGARPWAR